MNWGERGEKMVGVVNRVLGRLKSAFEGIVVQRERRWRSLATCHRDSEEREEARERSYI